MVSLWRSVLKSIPGMADPFSLKATDRSVPSLYLGNGNGRQQKVRFESVGELPAGRCTADSSGLLERLQCLAQALVFDREHLTKLRPGQQSVFDKEVEHSFLEIMSLLATNVSDHLQMRRLSVGRDQIEVHGSSRGRRAVLAGQHQAIGGSPEVKIRVAEGVDVTGTTQS